MQKHCEATLPVQDARGLQGVPGEDQLQAKHPNPHSGGTLLYTYYVLLFVTEKSATKSENLKISCRKTFSIDKFA